MSALVAESHAYITLPHDLMMATQFSWYKHMNSINLFSLINIRGRGEGRVYKI
jgi:hypothetical protein